MAELKNLLSINFTQPIIKTFFSNLVFSLIILFLGIVLGRLIGRLFQKIAEKLELKKYVRPSFIDLFLVIIRWSIYIIFINFAIKQLEISILNYITEGALLIIPAFTGALLVLTFGFAIAVYLKEVIKDSKVNDWEIFSKIVYYFVLYIFGIYSLRLALIILDEKVMNTIILIITATLGLLLILTQNKQKKEVLSKNSDN